MGLEWLWHLRLPLMFRLLKMLRVAADKIQLTAKSAALLSRGVAPKLRIPGAR